MDHLFEHAIVPFVSHPYPLRALSRSIKSAVEREHSYVEEMVHEVYAYVDSLLVSRRSMQYCRRLFSHWSRNKNNKTYVNNNNNSMTKNTSRRRRCCARTLRGKRCKRRLSRRRSIVGAFYCLQHDAPLIRPATYQHDQDQLLLLLGSA